MGFKIINDQKVVVFGKTMSGVWLALILFGYGFFLAIIWPMFNRSFMFIPLIVCLLPAIVPEFLDELLGKYGRKLKLFVIYTGTLFSTYIYTQFFTHTSGFGQLMHFVLYLLFAYLWSRKY